MNLLGKVAKEFGEYVAGEDQRGAPQSARWHCLAGTEALPGHLPSVTCCASSQKTCSAVQVSALRTLQLRICCSA